MPLKEVIKNEKRGCIKRKKAPQYRLKGMGAKKIGENKSEPNQREGERTPLALHLSFSAGSHEYINHCKAEDEEGTNKAVRRRAIKGV